MLSQLYMRTRLARKLKQKKRLLKNFCDDAQTQTLTQDFAVQFKKSDTVFILGSGSSINQVSDKQWQAISPSDSIGFNNWTVHPFIPSYYFFEPTSSKNDFQNKVNKTLYNNLLNREKDYREVPIVLGYLEKYFYDWPIILHFPHTAFFSSVNLPADDRSELHSSYVCALNNGYFKNVSLSVYRRGSVARIIHFCLSLGYKNIVLLGVDLNTSPYFFDEKSFELVKGAEPLWYTQTLPAASVHETVNPNVHPVTMLDVIDELANSVAPDLNATIYNGSQSSALINHLPFYWDKGF